MPEISQRNRFLDNPVWIRVTRIVYEDDFCKGAYRGARPLPQVRWFHANGLLAAIEKTHYAYRTPYHSYEDSFPLSANSVSIEYWLCGCERISDAVVEQYIAWSGRLFAQRKALHRAKTYRKHPGRKRSWTPWFKRPKTLGARRDAQDHHFADLIDDGYEVPKVRAKQNAKNLPNAWDDWRRSDLKQRSWKHYRKTQYRGG
jgi:hypothetical protein